MDFDEYEYLEKTVDDSENRNGSSKKKESGEKREKGHRRREEEDEQEEVERRRRKHSRNEEENGERKRDERERSERRREREDRRRSDKDGEKEKDKDRDREREKDRERRDREKDREKEKERERRSSSRSKRQDSREGERERERERELREREREIAMRDGRRFKDKKESEPEADPERDQRTVFAYQMPLKATERDVYEFFSKAGKVRDVRVIMDRNSRRSKGVGYIEFYDAMSVPMAITLSGQLLLGQPVMVKPSEAEKNLVQPTATSGGSNVTGPADRKLYVGNLHFNMTEQQLRQIFEPFGPVELVQLPLDLETGQCKGFGFVQFAQVEHAKAAVSLNGNLEIAGRVIKVSSVTEHVSAQDTGTGATDLDDDEGGGLTLNAQSRAMLMQKLDRTGTASGITGPLGAPGLNGLVPVQSGLAMPNNGQAAFPAASFPGQPLASTTTQVVVGSPTECLMLQNLFDPATESDPEFFLDVKEDVEGECSKFGRVEHIYVDRNSAGHVYLRFENKEAAMNAQRAMHNRWFAQKLISAIFLQPYEYEAKCRETA